MADQTPPPPANPYGGPPPAQPYGQPAQPQGAPAPQSGQPMQPAGQPGFTEPYPPAAPEKKSGVGKKVLSVIGAILAVVVVIGLKTGVRDLFSEDDKTADAKVGDCVGALPEMAAGEEKKANAEIVKCADAGAQFSVVGRVDKQTETQANSDDVCAPFKEAEVTYLVSSDGKEFYVLCLKPVAAK